MDEKKRKLALQAYKLLKEGLKGKAIGEKLGVTTGEANTLTHIGAHLVEVDAAALTAPEVLLIRSIAAVDRRLRNQGEVRSPESWEVASVAGKCGSWVGATSKKRLRDSKTWDAKAQDWRPDGLGLVRFTTNGYVLLTPLGWAFVQALEAAEEAAKNPLQIALARARDAIQDVVSGECNTERGDDLNVLQNLLKELNARLPTA